MASNYFVLDEDLHVVPAHSYNHWLSFFGSPRRVIKNDHFDNTRVSTVFIGLDDNLFETIVFFENGTQEELRYDTYDQALDGHNEICALIRAGCYEH